MFGLVARSIGEETSTDTGLKERGETERMWAMGGGLTESGSVGLWMERVSKKEEGARST